MSHLPLRSTFMLIRSKDAKQLTTGLNTNFRVNLVSPIVASANEEIHTSLISASIPHSFYCISANLGNNTVVYDTINTLTLPTQNYDTKELVRIFNDDAGFSALFTASYNRFTNKISFLNKTGIAHDLNWALSGASKLLGYGNEPDETVANGASSTSSGMIDLATIHSVIIKSDISQGNIISSSSSNSTVLQKINIDKSPYSMIYLDGTDRLTYSISQGGRIDSITFSLMDQNDILLDLNNINYELSVQFLVYPKFRDVIPGTSLEVHNFNLQQQRSGITTTNTQPFRQQASLPASFLSTANQPTIIGQSPITNNEFETIDTANESILDVLLS